MGPGRPRGLIEFLLFLMIVAGGVAIALLAGRVARAEEALRALEWRLEQEERQDRATAPTTPAPAPSPAAMRVAPPPAVHPEAEPVAAVLPEPAPPSAPAQSAAPAEPESEPAPAFSLERLIGGKLPVWIGGAALVLASFFLVRYTIEIGLFGPGVRTLAAAGFSLLLLGGSEAARRHRATRDDPRIAQVLAGAGIASAYGTLYVAAALYHLIGPGVAFALTAAVTLLGLGLALRHGPPTAIMALIGGFAAPMVAGYDSGGIVPLLLYLGLLIGALFGLSVLRGWAWLAWAALAAGFGWTGLLTLTLDRSAAAWVGAFVVLLAVAATLALPRSGARRPMLAALPLLGAALQLILIASLLDTGPLGWGYLLVLSAAALVLAWRDAALLPGAGAALAMLIGLTGQSFAEAPTWVAVAGAGATTLLFGGAGLMLSRRHIGWSAIALAGLAGPYLAARIAAPDAVRDPVWAAVALAPLLGAALMAWRHRGRADLGQVGGAALAALLWIVALQPLMSRELATLPALAAMLGLLAWSSIAAGSWVARLAVAPWLMLVLMGAGALGMFADAAGSSILGSSLPYAKLTLTPFELIRLTVIPVAITLLVLWRQPRAFAGARPLILAVEVARAALVAYWLLKQPLAIATPDRFVAWGFAERAAITQLCLAAGWLLLRRPATTRIGRVFFLLGLARVFWFDLLLFDPLDVRQWVGPWPVLNLAVVHAALIAFWCARSAGGGWARLGTLGFAMAAVLLGVRQAVHGAFLTGPVTRVENWGYSAALMAVAALLLWRGIARARHEWRVAGLALMTLATLKVFLIDAAALEGLLRILSFLALGLALIAIGWAYQRFVGPASPLPKPESVG